MRLFHRFVLGKMGQAVLLEPRARCYVWLSLFVERRHRRKGAARMIYDGVTAVLAGEHHLHCLKRVRALERLAATYKWDYRGDSPYFERCSYFVHDAPGGAHDGRLAHAVLRRRPWIPTVPAIEAAYVVRTIMRGMGRPAAARPIRQAQRREP